MDPLIQSVEAKSGLLQFKEDIIWLAGDSNINDAKFENQITKTERNDKYKISRITVNGW